MDESAVAAYMALRHNRKLPACQFARLIRQYQTITALLAAPENEYLARQVAAPDAQTLRLVDEERQWAEADQQHLLYYESPHYPQLLKQIDCPPPVLAVRGTGSLNAIAIALVGSRNCSAYGKRTAFWLASELAALGITVTSGLALGIDTAAHEGALCQQADNAEPARPPTIAVVANGLDLVYPLRNRKLAQSIAERGALVSEFTLGSKPLPHYFPRRNRIISGLSHGVVVIEAAMKSGSLITARLAMEQNRDVFAVPGPITSAQAEGCHWLIKNGARLVEGPADILTELNAATLALLRTARSETREVRSERQNTERIDDPQCRKLLCLLRGESLLFDELRERSGLHTDSLSAALLQLEILGRIEISAGRIYPL